MTLAQPWLLLVRHLQSKRKIFTCCGIWVLAAQTVITIKDRISVVISGQKYGPKSKQKYDGLQVAHGSEQMVTVSGSSVCYKFERLWDRERLEENDRMSDIWQYMADRMSDDRMSDIWQYTADRPLHCNKAVKLEKTNICYHSERPRKLSHLTTNMVCIQGTWWA